MLTALHLVGNYKSFILIASPTALPTATLNRRLCLSELSLTLLSLPLSNLSCCLSSLLTLFSISVLLRSL